MSGTLSLALNTARSGLLTNQAALDVVANNVSNANTEGYTRKDPQFQSRTVAGAGAGVQLSQISRSVDEGLRRNIREELGALNAMDARGSYFSRIQDLFGRPEENSSLSHILAEFSGATQSLAVNPQDALAQREMVRWGQEVAVKFNRMGDSIQNLRLEADQRIGQAVDEINGLLRNIAELNNDIGRNGAVGLDTGDLRDQRDLALERLSGLMDIRTFTGGSGEVVVLTADGQKLADNRATTLSHVSASFMGAGATHGEGDLDGIYVGAAIAQNDITNSLRSGELAGLVEMRDTILPNLQNQIDELAAELRDAVNQVHNRGVPFPGMTEMTGTRAFTEPATQTVTFAGTDDTTLALFDASGKEVRSTTVRALLGGAGGTVQDVASAIDTWLGADGSAAMVDGRLAISVTGADRALTIRDQGATAAGSAAKDAVLQFDADADGGTDLTVEGFSNFFGLNDFYVDLNTDSVQQSKVVNPIFIANAATLTFRNASGAMGPAVAVSAGDGLRDIADSINAAALGVTASVVTDGSGARLRIGSDDGSSFTVTQDVPGGDNLLTNLGMHPADLGVSDSLAVRGDIVSRPGLVSRGAVQWDPALGTSGRYFLSQGDDAGVRALADVFTSANAFDAAGGIDAVGVTFSQYAADIISENGAMAETNADRAMLQGSLVESLQHKSNSISGVNLDEEMADLILFEQAYSAAARVFSAIQSMFDDLESII